MKNKTPKEYKKCSKCGEKKSLLDFYKNSRTGRPNSSCKDCVVKVVLKHHRKILNNPILKAKECVRRNAWKKTNREKIREWGKNYNRNLRLGALSAYGGRNPKCACCGESTYDFLSIDHLNGGGVQHLKRIKNEGCYNFYLWLKKNNYPVGYQVLCYNCNFSKGHCGKCPHQINENK